VALGPTNARRSTKAHSQVQLTPRAWGGNGAAAHQERHETSPVHGETATRRRLAARRHAHRKVQEKVTAQGKRRPRCSQRGGGVVVAGLSKTVARRGRTRRHLAPCSASTSSPGVSVPPPPAATRPAPVSGASAATRRKASPCSASISPALPTSLLSAALGSRKRKNPN
jgi:hypothetical protein